MELWNQAVTNQNAELYTEAFFKRLIDWSLEHGKTGLALIISGANINQFNMARDNKLPPPPKKKTATDIEVTGWRLRWSGNDDPILLTRWNRHLPRRLPRDIADPAMVDLVLTDPPYGLNYNNGDLAEKREQCFGGNKEKQVARL